MNEPVRAATQAPVKSAERALALLDLVAERERVRFADVVDSGIPKASAHALLATLTGSGWLDYSPRTREYGLGLRAWQLGRAYTGHRRLLEVAEPVMADLVDAVGETAQLARLDGVENLYIAIRPSPHPMRIVSSVGMRLQAHATGIGKALLGTLPEDEARRRIGPGPLPRLTANTQTDPQALLRRVRADRERGYALDDEEFVEGCRCVAVPIASEPEIGIAVAMSITMPTQRTDDRWPGPLLTPLHEARGAIRRALGLDADAPTDATAPRVSPPAP